MTKSTEVSIPHDVQSQSHPNVSLWTRLASELDGSNGTFREKSIPALIDADNDGQAIQSWLRSYIDSPHTYRAYRKEAERLLLWCVTVKLKPLSGLNRDDLDDFFSFTGKPPAEWIADRSYPHGHPNWRPFLKPHTQYGQKQAKVILSSLFAYLMDARYLNGNPLSLIRRKFKKKKSSKTIISPERRHAFSYETCEVVRDYLRSQIEEAEGTLQGPIRDQIMFEVFLRTGGRVAELANARMCDLHLDDGQWWLYVLGKGNKEADLPLRDELMGLITRYRGVFGLSPYPTPNEPHPFFISLRQRKSGGTLKGVTDNMVYRCIKEILQRSADLAERRKLPGSAEHLRRASTHWLRHTTLTHAYDETHDLLFVQDLGRHESLETTKKYITSDRKALHKKVSDLK